MGTWDWGLPDARLPATPHHTEHMPNTQAGNFDNWFGLILCVESYLSSTVSYTHLCTHPLLPHHLCICATKHLWGHLGQDGVARCTPDFHTSTHTPNTYQAKHAGRQLWSDGWPARCTSRPSGGGSRLEAVFRFPRVERRLFSQVSSVQPITKLSRLIIDDPRSTVILRRCNRSSISTVILRRCNRTDRR